MGGYRPGLFLIGPYRLRIAQDRQQVGLHGRPAHAVERLRGNRKNVKLLSGIRNCWFLIAKHD